ncbi:hypothetical protein [Capillimicrobium parvum]|uniref:Uncharacterized protein n=1 Tax=Capillimicrobium parvum TaxID=2884022 RepID=A0A9E6XX72_9ACTN|nr:hypothetical protein [Capillimicrobium parvum]UGS36174.1 hypothetical protein DSM104329_02574 [Capillimicrobium parvum]
MAGQHSAAAAVQSMSSSWHALLYGSFDASGVMTVDKPPLALWVQALSARAFGFGSWSMLVPQAAPPHAQRTGRRRRSCAGPLVERTTGTRTVT